MTEVLVFLFENGKYRDSGETLFTLSLGRHYLIERMLGTILVHLIILKFVLQHVSTA